jgi:ATP-dependent Clp protease adaptor protein ClpS
MSERTEIQEKRKTLEKTEKGHCLVLYNDDVNTFDHVINCLMRICSHELIQAEQCAWLVHQKGRCKVKNGSVRGLRSMCEALLENGLTAQIE